jgi:hypothetical protein
MPTSPQGSTGWLPPRSGRVQEPSCESGGAWFTLLFSTKPAVPERVEIAPKRPSPQSLDPGLDLDSPLLRRTKRFCNRWRRSPRSWPETVARGGSVRRRARTRRACETERRGPTARPLRGGRSAANRGEARDSEPDPCPARPAPCGSSRWGGLPPSEGAD